MVQFGYGVQSFTLDYRVENKEEADWMRDRLMDCFDKYKEDIKKELCRNE